MEIGKTTCGLSGLSLAALLVVLPGCGGAGFSAEPVAEKPPDQKPEPEILPPFPHVPGLTFPTKGPAPGAMNMVKAFPKLTFQKPLFLTHAPDDSNRLFVMEQYGSIVVFDNDKDADELKVFLQLRTSWGAEQGLFSMAFDPNYKTNGYFYVVYTADNPRRASLSRFKVDPKDPDRADPTSEVPLIVLDRDYEVHNAGMVAFGADGLLYAGFGDGGMPDTAQDLANLRGTVVRIDPHGKTGTLPYGIPASNPFVATTGARGEIWAYGFRSPWRFSFDRKTGAMFLGDVGASGAEEINLVEKGGNYGWNWYEGNKRNDGRIGNPPTDATLIEPLLDLSHSGHRAVIGGYVYRGNKLPSLRGAYLVADFPTWTVSALTVEQGTVKLTGLGSVSRPASFGEDKDGEVYIVSLDQGIYRMEQQTAPPQTFPTKLSQTGLFTDTAALKPHASLLHYDVAEPLWSDGAAKHRWLALPKDGRIEVATDGTWAWPAGTVLVKHFGMPVPGSATGEILRLETRVMVNEADGWGGYTYRWNATQTDAVLLTKAESQDVSVPDATAIGGARTVTWNFPGPFDCRRCHHYSRPVLGPVARQVAHQDQLKIWRRIGMFAAAPSAPTVVPLPSSADGLASLEDRARSYLAVNCSSCHFGGSSDGAFDLSFETDFAQTGLADGTPLRGTLGITDGKLIVPGSKEKSVLWQRMQRLDGNRMPPLGTGLVDDRAVRLVGDWIDRMPH